MHISPREKEKLAGEGDFENSLIEFRIKFSHVRLSVQLRAFDHADFCSGAETTDLELRLSFSHV